jgi:hypothetical protein
MDKLKHVSKCFETRVMDSVPELISQILFIVLQGRTNDELERMCKEAAVI